jgi:pimeloyl-ACP methyl ester carboxylesterase
VLVGASWGTILGLHIAQKHPEWLHAYVGIGQGVDVAESERRGWRWAMARAREASHAQAMRELQSLAPYAEDRPPTRDEIELQRRWLLHFGGGVYRRRSGAAEAAAMRLAPEYSDVDVAKVWEANDFSERHLLAAALTTDLSRVRELKVPVVLFSGRSDYVVNAVLAEEWLAKLTAPHKRFVWFEQSGHDVFVEEPGKTLVSLVQYVLPLTGHRAGMPGRGAGRRPR